MIRVTPEEKQTITEAANSASLSHSSFVRALVLSHIKQQEVQDAND